MRVITGQFRGRRLSTIKNHVVRPATNRVKQTVFDVLSTRVDLTGVNVLDLFAGSGSLGIEAISRGASHVDFVEHMGDAADCIEENLAALGCARSARVWRSDAWRFIDRPGQVYELIFADPPYDFAQTRDIPTRIFSHDLLARNGYLVVEHAKGVRFQTTGQFTTGPEKRFGRTLVTFFTHPAATTT